MLVCESSGLLKIIAFIKILIDIIFIIVPVGLIVMVSIDFSKAVISGDDGAQKKAVELGFNRIMYAAILFAVPYIVETFMTIIGDSKSDYINCLKLAGNPAEINRIESAEQVAKKAMEEAKERARQALIGAKAEEEKDKTDVENNPATIKAEGCDGVVYYENGTFYKPSQTLVPKNGIPKTKGSATAGYNKYFYEYLTKFVEAAKKEGHTIIPSPNEGDGAWRSYERQQYWWEVYNHDINKAAFPGTSNHGWAIASDLKFGNMESDLYWAHDHANEYNLRFPLCQNVRTGPCGENWHIEPKSIVVNDERAKACV